MENFKWLHLLYAVILISTAQVIVWFQHNWQFVNPKYKPEWWGWYVMAIPITWFFLKGTQREGRARDTEEKGGRR